MAVRKAAKIVVVGSINMDLIARGERIPRPGETIVGGGFRTVPGGKGANQAVASARLGANVKIIGRVGTDAFGDLLLENLGRAGVDASAVERDAEEASGIALIMIDDAAQNSILVAPGANMRLTPAHVEAAEAVIAAADVLLVQLEIMPETVLRAVELAHAHGVQVVLNPAPARPLPAGLPNLIDVLIPNEYEAALLTGAPAGSVEEAKAAAQILLALGPQTVIITLGWRGSLLAQAGSSQHFPAFKITPVDTTAAGDAFVGSFATALAEGAALEEAVRWGNAAGALAATRLGAQPSLPHRKEVEELLK
jgi:ribokinase